MYCAASLRDIGISQRANPVQNGSTCIVAGDAASMRDIGISQRANPVQKGSTCIVAGDAVSLRDIGISQCANPVQNGSTCIVAGAASSSMISEYHNVRTRFRKEAHASKQSATGRACTSVAQQEEPAQASRSRKSLQKRCTEGRACTSVAQHKSLDKHGVQKSS